VPTHATCASEEPQNLTVANCWAKFGIDWQMACNVHESTWFWVLSLQGAAGQLALERRRDLHRNRAHAQPDLRSAQDHPCSAPVPARQARQVRSACPEPCTRLQGLELVLLWLAVR